jgi:hypothetical protein
MALTDTEKFLFSFRYAIEHAERILQQEEDLRERMISLHSVDLSAVKGYASGCRTDKMADYAAKLDDLQRTELAARIKALDAFCTVDAVIEQIQDSSMRELVTLRYLKGDRWQTVAERMKLSQPHAYDLRSKALAAAGEILAGQG